MSKINDTSKLVTLDHHSTLADSELVAVTGGFIKGESTDSYHNDGWTSLGGGTTTDPIGAWNTLLKNYGYA